MQGVEGDPDCASIVEDAEYDGIGPSSTSNERGVDTNALHRDRRPGGHIGELTTSKGVEGDWKRRNDGECVGYDGRRGGKDSATSGASHDSKRVGTRLLAGNKSGQNGKRKRANTDVPGPSRPPPSHPRRPTEPVDPPRQRGKLKTRTRKIRRSNMEKDDLPNRTATSRPKRAHRAHRICCMHTPDAGGAPHSDGEAARPLRVRAHAAETQDLIAEARLPY